MRAAAVVAVVAIAVTAVVPVVATVLFILVPVLVGVPLLVVPVLVVPVLAVSRVIVPVVVVIPVVVRIVIPVPVAAAFGADGGADRASDHGPGEQLAAVGVALNDLEQGPGHGADDRALHRPVLAPVVVTGLGGHCAEKQDPRQQQR